MIFQNPETVICSVVLTRTDTGAAIDPATSITITITNPSGTVVTNAVAMTKDGTGLYHYDFNPANAPLGNYDVVYIATNGGRVTIQDDNFSLS